MMSTVASFPSVRNQGLSTSRRKESPLKVLLADYLQDALPASATTWNLHTTQPKYFALTFSEVVNLTGLLKQRTKRIVWKEMFAVK